VETFREEYAKRYGSGALVLGAPMELVTLRAIGIGQTVRASLATAARAGVKPTTPAEAAGSRPVRIDRAKDHTVNVYSGPELQPGHQITGPALIDGSDTTIWIPAQARGRVDDRGTLIVEVS